jgi:urease accessory protein UreF
VADPRLVSLLQLTGRALPTGAFAYSDGLERLWRLGLIATPVEVHAVLAAHHALSIASGDAWFARTAHRATAPLRREALAACAREESAAAVAALNAPGINHWVAHLAIQHYR